MLTPLALLAALGDYFTWWQIPLIILLVVIIAFWVMYRRKQM